MISDIISSRIEMAGQCPVINLTPEEKDIYSGAGWKLARFEEGVLAGFFDPQDVSWQASAQAMADKAIKAAIEWLGSSVQGNSETWLVMCSGYQLCEPRRVHPGDVSSLAYMARIFGEVFADE